MSLNGHFKHIKVNKVTGALIVSVLTERVNELEDKIEDAAHAFEWLDFYGEVKGEGKKLIKKMIGELND